MRSRSAVEAAQPGEFEGVSGLVILPVDPFRVHVYWRIELPPETQHDNSFPGRSTSEVRAILRFQSIPNPSVIPEECTEFFDVPVMLDAPNWYVQLPRPSGRYLVELGIKAEDGCFIGLARSALVQVPPASPSEIDDEIRMLVMGDFLLTYPLPGPPEERPAESPLPAPGDAAAEPGQPWGFASAAQREPMEARSDPVQDALFLSKEAIGLALSEPAVSRGTTLSPLCRLPERNERSFTPGLSSLQLSDGAPGGRSGPTH